MICELIDGVLVEKTMGYYQSLAAILLGRILGDFVEKHDLGIVLGEAGTLRVLPGQVRIPDLCVIRWNASPAAVCRPSRSLPLRPTWRSKSFRRVIRRARCGASSATTSRPACGWSGISTRRRRTVEVYTSPEQCTVVAESGALDGGDVLPGFTLPLSEFFCAPKRAAASGNRTVDACPNERLGLSVFRDRDDATIGL